MSNPAILPQQDQDESTLTGRYKVVIFDNPDTPQDDVYEILMRATGCDQQEAEIEIWEAETYGKAAVHFATRAECESAAWLISSIGVRTEVSPEWDS